jgi:hypothetical protein
MVELGNHLFDIFSQLRSSSSGILNSNTAVLVYNLNLSFSILSILSLHLEEKYSNTMSTLFDSAVTEICRT